MKNGNKNTFCIFLFSVSVLKLSKFGGPRFVDALGWLYKKVSISSSFFSQHYFK